MAFPSKLSRICCSHHQSVVMYSRTTTSQKVHICNCLASLSPHVMIDFTTTFKVSCNWHKVLLSLGRLIISLWHVCKLTFSHHGYHLCMIPFCPPFHWHDALCVWSQVGWYWWNNMWPYMFDGSEQKKLVYWECQLSERGQLHLKHT